MAGVQEVIGGYFHIPSIFPNGELVETEGLIQIDVLNRDKKFEELWAGAIHLVPAFFHQRSFLALTIYSSSASIPIKLRPIRKAGRGKLATKKSRSIIGDKA